MEIDIIEIRTYNYFQINRQVKQITEADLPYIKTILPHLSPIRITKARLLRLNFYRDLDGNTEKLIKRFKTITFSFEPLRYEALLLKINNDVRLPHISYVHQLQNVYYDLTGEVLKRLGEKN